MSEKSISQTSNVSEKEEIELEAYDALCEPLLPLSNADANSDTTGDDLPIFVEHYEGVHLNGDTAKDDRHFRNRFNRTESEDTETIPFHLLHEAEDNEEDEDLCIPSVDFDQDIKYFDQDDIRTEPDIAAMSVLSLYQSAENLDAEMDTDKDLLEYHQEKPKIVIPPKSSFEAQPQSTPTKLNESSQSCDRCNGLDPVKCPKIKNFFKDGVRSIDFVLVWDAMEEKATTSEAIERRKTFERNLRKEGLQLEHETQVSVLNFVKIHTPKEVLRRYAEILKMRMPMKEELCVPEDSSHCYAQASSSIFSKIPGMSHVQARTNFIIEGINSQWNKIKKAIFINPDVFPKKCQRFTSIYRRDREYLFDADSPCFFTPAIRSRIVQFILDRKRFMDKNNDDFAFGIERLLNEETYSAAYPLHDGDLKQPGSTRHLLYEEWASIRKWYRYQPLDYIKEYFGVKIALYFAWLGFYTHMLLPAAVVGIACFIYSCVTLFENKPSEDICNMDIGMKMCPLCDYWCEYWNLKETCMHARISYLFDNSTTVFFAVFMCFWATIFLELWKRYSAEITHRWDLTGFDIQEEHPRPQYLARLAHVKHKHVNVITNTMEPCVPFWRIKVPATIFSFSVVLLLVVLALAVVIAVVLYRISVFFGLRAYSDNFDNSTAMLLITCTAACINLVFIVIFNWLYTFVAEYLTEMELLRTQSEFDDSLTLKIYLLQFVNYYGSIFYIAFFKGRLVGSPNGYNRIFGYRQEECGAGGCLLELSIQLAIIMIGKQVLNSILEMMFPLFFKWMNTLKIKTGLRKYSIPQQTNRPQWLKDFKLLDWGPRSLFPEYLEMILQYGFLTIFVTAFPLGPFFALLNNVLEMRLDARKLLTFYRRPVTQRVRDIGVWYRILDSIGKLSVITNAVIIAFTSDFIPHLVYQLAIIKNNTLDNYVNYSLAVFDTAKFENKSIPRHNTEKYCRYSDFREPPDSPDAYSLTPMYWLILAARLMFVLIFENIVACMMIVVRWCIPDMPTNLKNRIRREAYITNEIIIQQETLRAQQGYCTSSLQEEPPQTPEIIRTMHECPSTPEQWDRVISKSLSGSEFNVLCGTGDCSDKKPKTPTSV